MNRANLRSRIRCKLLCTCVGSTSPKHFFVLKSVNQAYFWFVLFTEFFFEKTKNNKTFQKATLDDVEDGDVAPSAGGTRHHDVLGLQQAPHHIQHRGLAHRGGSSGVGQGSVPMTQMRVRGEREREREREKREREKRERERRRRRRERREEKKIAQEPGHEKVASRGGDQARHEADEVIVHVARVAQSGGRGGHHRAHEAVRVFEGGRIDVQAIHRDAVQSGVVQHHHAIRVQSEALERKHGVVRLHHDLTLVCGEHAVSLDQLLGIAIVESLQQIRAAARARSSRDGVSHHEPFE